MSAEDLQKLLNGGKVEEKKKKTPRLRPEEASYLEPLLAKWGVNYERMAKDVKLNRMQWTAHQISKKHGAYKHL